jgi:hypothetical protein
MRSFLELYAEIYSFLFGNVAGRGDCKRNYTVNYLKKIEMPKDYQKHNEDKCTINQMLAKRNENESKFL